MMKTLLENQWHRFDSISLFNKVIDLLFKLLIFFVVLVLAMGLVKMFLEVWTIMTVSELKEAFGFIVTNLLTFFYHPGAFQESRRLFSRTPTQADVYRRRNTGVSPPR